MYLLINGSDDPFHLEMCIIVQRSTEKTSVEKILIKANDVSHLFWLKPKKLMDKNYRIYIHNHNHLIEHQRLTYMIIVFWWYLLIGRVVILWGRTYSYVYVCICGPFHSTSKSTQRKHGNIQTELLSRGHIWESIHTYVTLFSIVWNYYIVNFQCCSFINHLDIKNLSDDVFFNI